MIFTAKTIYCYFWFGVGDRYYMAFIIAEIGLIFGAELYSLVLLEQKLRSKLH